MTNVDPAASQPVVTQSPVVTFQVQNAQGDTTTVDIPLDYKFTSSDPAVQQRSVGDVFGDFEYNQEEFDMYNQLIQDAVNQVAGNADWTLTSDITYGDKKVDVTAKTTQTAAQGAAPAQGAGAPQGVEAADQPTASEAPQTGETQQPTAQQAAQSEKSAQDYFNSDEFKNKTPEEQKKEQTEILTALFGENLKNAGLNDEQVAAEIAQMNPSSKFWKYVNYNPQTGETSLAIDANSGKSTGRGRDIDHPYAFMTALYSDYVGRYNLIQGKTSAIVGGQVFQQGKAIEFSGKTNNLAAPVPEAQSAGGSDPTATSTPQTSGTPQASGTPAVEDKGIPNEVTVSDGDITIAGINGDKIDFEKGALKTEDINGSTTYEGKLADGSYAKVVIDSEGNSTVEKYTKYSVNEDGSLKEGAKASQIDCYDRKTGEKTTRTFDENGEMISTKTLKYDGTVLAEATWKNGKLETRNMYNENGVLTLAEKYGDDGKLTDLTIGGQTYSGENFVANPDGSYSVIKDGKETKITQDPTSGFTVTEPNGQVKTFNTSGKMIKINVGSKEIDISEYELQDDGSYVWTDPNNKDNKKAVSFGSDGSTIISSTDGNSLLAYKYDSNNELTSIQVGSEIYKYNDGEFRLSGVSTRAITLGDDGSIIISEESRGNDSKTEKIYDANGRLTSVIINGQKTEIPENAEIDASGNYVFENSEGKKVIVSANSGSTKITTQNDNGTQNSITTNEFGEVTSIEVENKTYEVDSYDKTTNTYSVKQQNKADGTYALVKYVIENGVPKPCVEAEPAPAAAGNEPAPAAAGNEPAPAAAGNEPAPAAAEQDAVSVESVMNFYDNDIEMRNLPLSIQNALSLYKEFSQSDNDSPFTEEQYNQLKDYKQAYDTLKDYPLFSTDLEGFDETQQNQIAGLFGSLTYDENFMSEIAKGDKIDVSCVAKFVQDNYAFGSETDLLHTLMEYAVKNNEFFEGKEQDDILNPENYGLGNPYKYSVTVYGHEAERHYRCLGLMNIFDAIENETLTNPKEALYLLNVVSGGNQETLINDFRHLHDQGVFFSRYEERFITTLFNLYEKGEF